MQVRAVAQVQALGNTHVHIRWFKVWVAHLDAPAVSYADLPPFSTATDKPAFVVRCLVVLVLSLLLTASSPSLAASASVAGASDGFCDACMCALMELYGPAFEAGGVANATSVDEFMDQAMGIITVRLCLDSPALP